MKEMQPQDVVDILRKHGTEVTMQQADKILKFMTTLAHIQIAQWLRNQEKSVERVNEKL